MSEFYYEETPEVKESVKNFCQKVNKYYHREWKKETKNPTLFKKSGGRIKELKIPLTSKNDDGEQYVLQIDKCQVTDEGYNIRVKEKLRLPKKDKYGRKELGGGEIWIQSQTHKIKDDGTSLTYVFSDSVSHWSEIMEKIGLEKGMKKQLKFVPESKRKSIN